MKERLMHEQSSQLWERATQVIPCGTQTLSKAPNQFAEGVYPIYLASGRGCRVWDVDGNEYIDYPLALGAVSLGYQYPEVDDAIRRQLGEGILFSLMHPLEVEVSEKISRLVPCAEQVRFTKTGSEATAAAVRIARACTGKSKIAACGYHGWHDWYAGVLSRNKGIPQQVRDLILPFTYNQVETLAKIFDENPNQIAAVILEPVALEAPRDGFLQKVKSLAQRHGAVLVFDEIITGFRFSLGGAQKLYEVTPDLAAMGKAVANGMPLCLVCGRKELMKECEEIFFSSTFGGEALSLAAAKATIEVMERCNVPQHLWRQGGRLLKGLADAIQKLGLKAEVTGFGPRHFLQFYQAAGEPSLLLKALFWQECIKRGVLFGNAQFVSYSHGDADIDRTLEVARVALERVREAVDSGKPEDWYEGRIPTEIFRRA